jgi:hypothetical protein
MRAKGHPEAQVTIYRSMPAQYAEVPLGKGDWVGISLACCKQHGTQDQEADDWPVMRYTARADQMRCPGDSLQEWGYWDRRYVALWPLPVGRSSTQPLSGVLGVEEVAMTQQTEQQREAALQAEAAELAFERRLAARLDESVSGDPSDFFTPWEEYKASLAEQSSPGSPSKT